MSDFKVCRICLCKDVKMYSYDRFYLKQYYEEVLAKKTHSEERPVACTLCDKRFKQVCSMKLHYRTFHLKEPYPKRNRKKKTDEMSKGDSDDNIILDFYAPKF